VELAAGLTGAPDTARGNPAGRVSRPGRGRAPQRPVFSRQASNFFWFSSLVQG